MGEEEKSGVSKLIREEKAMYQRDKREVIRRRICPKRFK